MLITHIMCGTPSDTIPYSPSFIWNGNRDKWYIDMGIPYATITCPGEYLYPSDDPFEVCASKNILNNTNEIDSVTYMVTPTVEQHSFGVTVPVNVERNAFSGHLFIRMLNATETPVGKCDLCSIIINTDEFILTDYSKAPTSFPIIQTFYTSNYVGLTFVITDSYSYRFSEVYLVNKKTNEKRKILITNDIITIDTVKNINRTKQFQQHLVTFNPRITQRYIVFKDDDAYNKFFDAWNKGFIEDELYGINPFVTIFDESLSEEENIEAIRQMINYAPIDNILLVGVKLKREVLKSLSIRHASVIELDKSYRLIPII